MTKKSKIITEPENSDIQAFDLASPENRIGAVQAIIDNVCKQFERKAKQMFQHTLRRPVEFSYKKQHNIKLREYLQPLSKQALYREFNVVPFELAGTLAIERELQFFLVDIFFGGKGINTRKTDISDTELRMVDRFFSQILAQFSASWQTTTTWQCELAPKSRLQEGNGPQGEQLYLVCRFTLETAGHSGWLDISLPFESLDFLRDQQGKTEDVEADPELQRKIRSTLKKAPIRLTTTLCERRLMLGDVMGLKAGDVIPVEMPGEVTVRAGKSPLFTARVAENNSTLVLHIQNVIEK